MSNNISGDGSDNGGESGSKRGRPPVPAELRRKMTGVSIRPDFNALWAEKARRLFLSKSALLEKWIREEPALPTATVA